MNITTTGRHFEVTDGMKEHLSQKLERLNRHASKPLEVQAIFEKQREEHHVSLKVHTGATHLHAEATSHDMYASMDAAVDKLVRQLGH